VAKPELGTKRLCPNCGTKYYDLDRNPIVCPKCGTPFAAVAAVARPKPAPAEEEDEVEVEDDSAPVDFVSLEEADAEESGGEEVPVADDEEIADIGGDLDDDTFLEEDEEDADIDTLDIDVAPDEEER
jgi:uncharacterized protein (TIGR02300 family)